MSDPTAPTAASLRIDRSAPVRRRRGSAAPWIAGIVLVGAVGAFAWFYMGRAVGTIGSTSVSEGRAQRVSPTAKFERTTASGYVVARTRAAISARQPGKLIRLLVDVGDDVEEGQLLAEMLHEEEDAAVARWEAEAARAVGDIGAAEAAAAERTAALARARRDQESARAVLAEAEAVLANAEAEEKRLESLLASEVVTRSERDRAVMAAGVARAQAARAKASFISAEAESARAAKDAEWAAARVEPARASKSWAEAGLREARARREDFFIRAPFSGRVLRKEAEVGEVIAPATSGGGSTRGALLTLADFATLEIEVDVAERDMSLVREGAPCRIVLDAYPKDPFPGKVRQVVPTADRQKATVQVKVAFDTPDPRVLPEMGGRVVFLDEGATVSSEADRVVFPAAAAAERGGRRGVFVIEREGTDERVRFVPVTAAPEGEGRLRADSGLLGGERVVVDPPASLADGGRVSIRSGP